MKHYIICTPDFKIKTPPEWLIYNKNSVSLKGNKKIQGKQKISLNIPGNQNLRLKLSNSAKTATNPH